MLYKHAYTRIEFDWVGSDSDGLVGYFSTAGAGPVPAEALEDAEELVGILENILALPTTAQAISVRNVLNPPDWMCVAQRGIFAYDWSVSDGKYKLVARPNNPARIDALMQSVVGRLAARVTLRVGTVGEFEVLPNADDVL